MPNVRLDQNGVPMAPVYEAQAPAAHRTNVTAVDAGDPADASGGVDCAGYQECRFDLTIGGVDLDSLEVASLFWNPRQEVWFQGASRVFTTTGKHAIAVDARGAAVYLKVVAFTGTSFSLDADYVLS